jgi:hypothetical protein
MLEPTTKYTSSTTNDNKVETKFFLKRCSRNRKATRGQNTVKLTGVRHLRSRELLLKDITHTK